MHKFRWFLGALTVALAVVVAPASVASAAPETPTTDVRVSEPVVSQSAPGLEMVGSDVRASGVSYTTTTAWVRQCATLNCGYHPIPAGRYVDLVCHTSNAGIFWNMVITQHPTNPNLPIAGFVDTKALAGFDNGQPCSSVGVGPNRPAYELWAHSCPAMACGYGVMQAGHDLAHIADTAQLFEGEIWSLVLDHDNVHKDLVGFVHRDDLF